MSESSGLEAIPDSTNWKTRWQGVDENGTEYVEHAVLSRGSYSELSLDSRYSNDALQALEEADYISKEMLTATNPMHLLFAIVELGFVSEMLERIGGANSSQEIFSELGTHRLGRRSKVRAPELPRRTRALQRVIQDAERTGRENALTITIEDLLISLYRVPSPASSFLQKWRLTERRINDFLLERFYDKEEANANRIPQAIVNTSGVPTQPITASHHVIQVAVDRLHEAIEVLRSMEDGTVESDLAKHVIVPALFRAIDALEVDSKTQQQIVDARRQLMEAQSLLERLAEVYKRHRSEFLVGIFSNAAWAVAQALG